MRFVCMRQCAALRAHYMRKHPGVYAEAMNRYNRQHYPLGGQHITVKDVLRLALREEKKSGK